MTLVIGLCAIVTLILGSAGSAGYAALRVDWPVAIRTFLTGPGRRLRILLLLYALLNIKNMPFVWTVRHIVFPPPRLGPRSLFCPMIQRARVTLLDLDYNLHKSNSTYLTDLDLARTRFCSYMIRPALVKLAFNARCGLVEDPRTGRAATGPLVATVGAVSCNFRREIGAFRAYEVWTRALGWDRKWVYLVTHFVVAGAARPTEWLDPGFAGYRVRRADDDGAAAGGGGGGGGKGSWEDHVYATTVTRLVTKIGRLTVHPAVLLEVSGLLPHRPGGWASGPDQLGTEPLHLDQVDLSTDGEWTWQRVEAMRRRGMETAMHLQGLESLHGTFDGGSNGALRIY